MVRKFPDTSGMQDMFVQKAIEERTALFEKAKAELQQQIDSIDKSSSENDSGMSDVEDRNERLYLEREMRALEESYLKDIRALKESQK